MLIFFVCARGELLGLSARAIMPSASEAVPAAFVLKLNFLYTMVYTFE